MARDTHLGTIIGCSVLKDEIEDLRNKFWSDWSAKYLPSDLHMRPNSLAQKVGLLVHQELSKGRKIVLAYGDCCHLMASLEKETGVVRVKGVNCIDLILGRDRYRQMITEGFFFLLPEWTSRWFEIFSDELGLSPDNASDLMGEMHTKLVYLDTGIIPVPYDQIEACSRFCGLPYMVTKTSLVILQDKIVTAMNSLEVMTP